MWSWPRLVKPARSNLSSSARPNASAWLDTSITTWVRPFVTME